MGFDFSNNTPIYLQISELLKIKIISGEYIPGERLPSVRDLGIALKANPNTVQRALSELEDDRLIFTERTNGKFVTEDKHTISRYKSQYANNLALDYIRNMENIGLSKADAVNLIKSIKEAE